LNYIPPQKHSRVGIYTEIETDTHALQKHGCIQIESLQPAIPELYKERYDYILTEKGIEIIEEKILPVLKVILITIFLLKLTSRSVENSIIQSQDKQL
jgi:hypothetical protein